MSAMICKGKWQRQPRGDIHQQNLKVVIYDKESFEGKNNNKIKV